VVTSATSAAVPEELYDSISQCGINALYSCLRHLGVQVPLDQLYSDIPHNENNEVNLYQLAEYARNCGLYVKPIKHPTLRILRKYLTGNSTAILQFKYPNGKGHIVALLNPKNSDIWVYDVPLDKFNASDETLDDLLTRSQGMLILSINTFERSILDQLTTSGWVWALLAGSTLAFFIVTRLPIKRDRRKKL